MRCLITGSKGMLGRELTPRVEERFAGATLAVGRDELDIAEPTQVTRCFEAFAPDLVFNCAAFTDVDGAESRPDEALRANGRGPGVLAAACAAASARLVHVSTDYVYAGDLGRALKETDPEAPVSVYGRSKLAGDEAVRGACENHVLARSAWLYGVGGRNFVDVIVAAAARGGPLRVVADQVGSPTSAPQLADALIELGLEAFRGTVHAAAAGATSWHGLAVEALRLAGLGGVEVVPISTEELGRPAPRPAYSALDTSLYASLVGHSLETWQAALARHLAGPAERPGVE